MFLFEMESHRATKVWTRELRFAVQRFNHYITGDTPIGMRKHGIYIVMLKYKPTLANLFIKVELPFKHLKWKIYNNFELVSKDFITNWFGANVYILINPLKKDFIY